MFHPSIKMDTVIITLVVISVILISSAIIACVCSLATHTTNWRIMLNPLLSLYHR